MRVKPYLECLEDRRTPIVHSWGALVVGIENSDNAGGGPATSAILNQSALGGAPVPIVASAGHSQGIPFDLLHAPGRDVVLDHYS